MLYKHGFLSTKKNLLSESENNNFHFFLLMSLENLSTFEFFFLLLNTHYFRRFRVKIWYRTSVDSDNSRNLP
jgi:hypothetical protein